MKILVRRYGLNIVLHDLGREMVQYCDPERGLELLKLLAGSDGGTSFVFHPIGKPEEHVGGFNAHMEVRSATEAEKLDRPELKAFATWVIDSGFSPGFPIRGFAREESREIIREAMLAYRIGHGSPVGKWENATIFDVQLAAGFMK